MTRISDPDEAPVDMRRAELSEARDGLADGAVRHVLKHRVVLCDNLDDVKAVQRGEFPRGAVRLDRARRE